MDAHTAAERLAAAAEYVLRYNKGFLELREALNAYRKLANVK